MRARANDLLRRSGRWVNLVAAALVVVLSSAARADAQIPPRFYWKTLAGTNAVPAIFQSLTGNVNPFDPSQTPSVDVEFKASVAIVGYAKLSTLFNRSSLLAILLPVGNISSETTNAGLLSNENTSGFGDPLVELGINVIGPPPIRSIPDLVRYEPGFSVDIIVDVAFPVGEYDNTLVANLGQNRWYGRVGAPIVWQLGAWVPGRRTTLEAVPSLWVYSDNDDFVGQTLHNDPKFQLEAHLTRDLTESLWVSLDSNWTTGGQSTLNAMELPASDMISVGFTLGYPISESLQLTAGYFATVNDRASTDLHMGGFNFSLVYGWHALIEGANRLGGG